MRASSKRGAALAYAIMVTAALLILAAGLISVAGANLNASQNSLESRQAYLDAKSAIEYGRAYLANYPEKEDEGFSILSTGSGAGFKIGSADAQNAVAVYDPSTRTIKAAARYRSSDRVRRLGYRLGESGGENSGGSPYEFFVSGIGYGDTKVFNEVEAPYISGSVQSVYPVVFLNLLRSEDLNTENHLTAPKVFCMGSPRPIEFYRESRSSIVSDFICIGGDNIYGQDYRNNSLDASHYSTLILKSKSSDKGVLCFTQNCTLQIDGNAFKRKVAIPSGYYYFQDGMNLFDLTNENKNVLLTPVDTAFLPSFVNKEQVNFIRDNYANFMDSEQGTWTYSSVWTDDGGKVSEGRPSNLSNGKEYSLTGNTVFFYIASCDHWEDAFRKSGNPNPNLGVYQAKRIIMRYVNDQKNLIIPENKTVVFQADTISLSTAFQDDEAGGSADQRPAITGHQKADSTQFILRPLHGDTLKLYVPNDLRVYPDYDSDENQSYLIRAGYYDIPETDLLSDSAKKFFERTEPEDPPSGGSGESGGGSATGGVYTDGL
ncbi:MAG: hypothetical protein E7518_07180 [Ruminococcaceae bacterium]|nr:hypothetical protein [Oscillospiraceae bacterium]